MKEIKNSVDPSVLCRQRLGCLSKQIIHVSLRCLDGVRFRPFSAEESSENLGLITLKYDIHCHIGNPLFTLAVGGLERLWCELKWFACNLGLDVLADPNENNILEVKQVDSSRVHLFLLIIEYLCEVCPFRHHPSEKTLSFCLFDLFKAVLNQDTVNE